MKSKLLTSLQKRRVKYNSDIVAALKDKHNLPQKWSKQAVDKYQSDIEFAFLFDHPANFTAAKVIRKYKDGEEPIDFPSKLNETTNK